MLTSEEALAEFDFRNGAIIPDRLTRPAHDHYLPIAEKLIETFANSIGATRQRVHQRAEAVLDHVWLR
jgi:predicted nuclease of restriction endonuclease-like RecB superfamily